MAKLCNSIIVGCDISAAIGSYWPFKQSVEIPRRHECSIQTYLSSAFSSKSCLSAAKACASCTPSACFAGDSACATSTLSCSNAPDFCINVSENCCADSAQGMTDQNLRRAFPCGWECKRVRIAREIRRCSCKALAVATTRIEEKRTSARVHVARDRHRKDRSSYDWQGW